jgi:predicted NUDIX family NTP pyrophosphohydrolase
MKRSAGLLLWRRRGEGVEVLLVHPGGPFWARKDRGAWTVPKGELAPGEPPLEAARREFLEECGVAIDGTFSPLPAVRQAGGKEVIAFAIEADFDVDALSSNVFTLEWPPKSGREATFPEVDRAEWMALDAARDRIHPAQAAWLFEVARLADAG